MPCSRSARAVVKWFDLTKRFGFAVLADGSGEAFLHANALSRNGIQAVNPGEILQVHIVSGPKGPYITEVVSVDGGTAAVAVECGPSLAGTNSNEPISDFAVEARGTVKWFNVQKKFGFIVREVGKQDVFVHASTLARSGIRTLIQGQSVVMHIAQRQKGLEAIRVDLI